ncbi:Glutathione S-transferase N-terminal domain/Outer mitochondrial membrane transport complex protein, putative [Angomonas deanei]|uniref:Glutathione S-transferase N-terminal domain/Outer mitochondrial membrane transport complex protein, putative n=1 Tax=Angomonas deanei TaxID=59799 RepID=A0A7G2CJ53_9TRYP|nr:Glutathione S-transferase N-terminal domain/Outer mitochondrial membrane transport complex protein, putative [Angomonas deanei]
MTVAMTEKYGPKQPTRLTPAELELRAGYRSKLPPAKASLPAGRGAAAGEDGFSSPNKGTAGAASTPGSTTKAPVAGGQAAPGTAGKTAAQAAPPGAAPAAAGKAAAQAAPSGAAPGATGKGQATASGSGKGSGSAASGGSSRGTAAQGSGKGAAAGGEAGASPSVSSKITALGSSLMQNRLFMSAFAVGAAALTVFSIYKGVELYNRYCLNRAITEMQQKELQTVHLYIHHRSPLSPSISIPCTRIETYLRVAKIPYEAHCISDPSVSPNGHLPFIVYDNQRVAGPQQIVDFLASTFNVFLDNQLTDDQYATGVAVMKALEYSLVRGYMRSIHVERPDLIRPYYSEMHHTPDFITRIALSRLRAHIEETNDTSGYNRLTSEQFQFELAKDAKAIETLLSRHAYLFSDAYPSSFDCALYAWLLPIVAMEDAADVNAVFEYIVASESLTNFVRRMTELAFPDLDELVLSALEGDQPPPSEPARPYSSQPASRQESRLSRVSLTERRNSLSNQSHRERRNSMSQRRQDLSRGDGRSLSNSVTPRREATQN